MKLTGWAEMTCYDTMYTQQRDLLKATTAGSPLSTNIVYNKSILRKQLCLKKDCCNYERPLNTGIPDTKCGTCCERASWTSLLASFPSSPLPSISLPSPPSKYSRSTNFIIRHRASTGDTKASQLNGGRHG